MKKHGWLALVLALALAFGSISTAWAQIFPPAGEGQFGLSAVVLCEALPVHQEPSASAATVKTLSFGDIIIVQPGEDGWAACFLSDDVDSSQAGYVQTADLGVDPGWFLTEDPTPVYAWNDTAAPRLALLEPNTLVPVLKTEGSWAVISLPGAAGWVYVSSQTARQNGERFEATVVLEGMEETIRCEHIVNDSLGIEMDYDYESFLRLSEGGRECFISFYDDPQQPLNRLEVTFTPQDAEAAAGAVSASLSGAYEVIRENRTLQNAGDCTVIDASREKGTDRMPDLLQTVYVIPAPGGSIVAAAQYTVEGAEGFGARISQMMNTLALIGERAQ